MFAQKMRNQFVGALHGVAEAASSRFARSRDATLFAPERRPFGSIKFWNAKISEKEDTGGLVSLFKGRKLGDAVPFTGPKTCYQISPGHVILDLSEEELSRYGARIDTKNPATTSEMVTCTLLINGEKYCLEGRVLSGKLSLIDDPAGSSPDSSLSDSSFPISLSRTQIQEFPHFVQAYEENHPRYSLSGTIAGTTNCVQFIRDAVIHLVNLGALEVIDQDAFNELKSLEGGTYAPQDLGKMIRKAIACASVNSQKKH